MKFNLSCLLFTYYQKVKSSSKKHSLVTLQETNPIISISVRVDDTIKLNEQDFVVETENSAEKDLIKKCYHYIKNFCFKLIKHDKHIKELQVTRNNTKHHSEKNEKQMKYLNFKNRRIFETNSCIDTNRGHNNLNKKNVYSFLDMSPIDVLKNSFTGEKYPYNNRTSYYNHSAVRKLILFLKYLDLINSENLLKSFKNINTSKIILKQEGIDYFLINFGRYKFEQISAYIDSQKRNEFYSDESFFNETSILNLDIKHFENDFEYISKLLNDCMGNKIYNFEKQTYFDRIFYIYAWILSKNAVMISEEDKNKLFDVYFKKKKISTELSALHPINRLAEDDFAEILKYLITIFAVMYEKSLLKFMYSKEFNFL